VPVAAALGDAAGLAAALPAGGETILGPAFGGWDLSGGEWQRLAIARAFCGKRRGWWYSMSRPRPWTHWRSRRSISASRPRHSGTGRSREDHPSKTARMRCVPPPICSCFVILKRPSSPVCVTCGPPQISFEKSPIVYTLTWSSYFSPKKASAPA
jgi:hypothetical protein